MPHIKVKENEPFDVALRRFKRAVEKTGLLTELRAREFYEKPTAERKRKLAAAVKRTHKRLRIDPKNETFDDAEANKLVGREHRKGFELPKIG